MSKEHTNCEDRISSLPDEILIMILDKLDARTTITTTILSKRWLDLPRPLHTCYDLSVHEFLPPRYHRLKQTMMEVKAGYEAEKNTHKLTDIFAIRDRHERWMGRVHLLAPILQRYERRAMRYYIKRVNAFLLAPKNVQQRRSVQKLKLQTFKTRRSSIDQWITAAIAGCGVEDLELAFEDFCSSYDFRLLDGLQNVRLKRLVLSNCYHCSAYDSSLFQRLTELTLCKLSNISTVYYVLSNCVQLVSFKLKYSCVRYAVLRIIAPTSKLKNLQVDNCKIRKIYLHSLPCLETFACRGQPTKLYYGELPRLRHVSLDFLHTGDNGEDESPSSNMTYPLSKFFKGMPLPEYLVLQLKGPQMWIEPTVIPSLFNRLTKLFIANVPIYWDIFWIFILLDAAPALESFHVHIDNSSEKTSAGLDVQVEHCEYHHLKEFVVIGFNGAGWQTGFVKQIMRASPRLRRVHLLDGHVVQDDERELGGLEIVPRRREWHECERSEVLDDLADGLLLRYPEIILE